MFGLLKLKSASKARVGVALLRDHAAVVAVDTTVGPRPALLHAALVPLTGAPGALATHLRDAGYARAPVSCVLRPDDYQLAMIEAPDVLPAELRAAVRWKLRDAIDFHVDDAIVDVFDLPAQGRRAQGRMMYAVAARRAAVQKHVQGLEGVRGFDVVDVPELCLRNLATLHPAAAGGVALVHIGEMVATVVLVRESTLYLARHLDLQATLRFDGGDAPVDAASVALQLQRSLDYYESNYDQPPIAEIAIAPTGARMHALADALRAETGLKVGVYDLADRFQCATPPDAELQSACLHAAGAALRDDRRTL